MKSYPQHQRELEEILRRLARNKKLFHEFLMDIFTPAELREFALRLQIVKKLGEGLPYRLIAQQLKTSVATVLRGSKELQQGHGGFRKILRQRHKKTGSPAA